MHERARYTIKAYLQQPKEYERKEEDKITVNWATYACLKQPSMNLGRLFNDMPLEGVPYHIRKHLEEYETVLVADGFQPPNLQAIAEAGNFKKIETPKLKEWGHDLTWLIINFLLTNELALQPWIKILFDIKALQNVRAQTTKTPEEKIVSAYSTFLTEYITEKYIDPLQGQDEERHHKLSSGLRRLNEIRSLAFNKVKVTKTERNCIPSTKQQHDDETTTQTRQHPIETFLGHSLDNYPPNEWPRIARSILKKRKKWTKEEIQGLSTAKRIFRRMGRVKVLLEDLKGSLTGILATFSKIGECNISFSNKHQELSEIKDIFFNQAFSKASLSHIFTAISWELKIRSMEILTKEINESILSMLGPFTAEEGMILAEPTQVTFEQTIGPYAIGYSLQVDNFDQLKDQLNTLKRTREMLISLDQYNPPWSRSEQFTSTLTSRNSILRLTTSLIQSISEEKPSSSHLFSPAEELTRKLKELQEAITQYLSNLTVYFKENEFLFFSSAVSNIIMLKLSNHPLINLTRPLETNLHNEPDKAEIITHLKAIKKAMEPDFTGDLNQLILDAVRQQIDQQLTNAKCFSTNYRLFFRLARVNNVLGTAVTSPRKYRALENVDNLPLIEKIEALEDFIDSKICSYAQFKNKMKNLAYLINKETAQNLITFQQQAKEISEILEVCQPLALKSEKVLLKLRNLFGVKKDSKTKSYFTYNNRNIFFTDTRERLVKMQKQCAEDEKRLTEIQIQCAEDEKKLAEMQEQRAEDEITPRNLI